MRQYWQLDSAHRHLLFCVPCFLKFLFTCRQFEIRGFHIKKSVYLDSPEDLKTLPCGD